MIKNQQTMFKYFLILLILLILLIGFLSDFQ